MNKIIENILNSCRGYINTRYQILELDVKDKVAGFIHNFINLLILLFIILMMVVFISISLILFIRDITGSLSIGCYSITFIYIVLFTYLLISKKNLFPKKIIENKINKSNNS